ncbi:hypothetical protein N9478_08740 [Gammaproteobacteria bacterium]|nr:hypothetical protein [Gammaproteobacteria bacterium]
MLNAEATFGAEARQVIIPLQVNSVTTAYGEFSEVNLNEDRV